MKWRIEIHLIAFALWSGAMVGGARANDTTAALTTGGLVFSKTADIEMRSEDLSISEKEIVVRYRFFNHSSADQTVSVAFPMPEISFGESGDVAIPDSESDNFLVFRTTVDGRAVSAAVEQKAFVGDADVTERLRALKAPLLPTAKETWRMLDALPAGVQEQLIAEKIVRLDEYDAGKGMERHIAPDWSLRTTFYWRQTFPAGREIVVEHRYKPSVGGSVQTPIGSDYVTSAVLRDYQGRYCTDSAFVAGAQALKRKNNGAPPPEYKIAYVLKTGANWAGPIGDFHLTVDKGSPDALISFCETGVTKTGPTTFEVSRKNFTPTRDLDILLLRIGG